MKKSSIHSTIKLIGSLFMRGMSMIEEEKIWISELDLEKNWEKEYKRLSRDPDSFLHHGDPQGNTSIQTYFIEFVQNKMREMSIEEWENFQRRLFDIPLTEWNRLS